MARGQVIDLPITSGLQEHEDQALTAGLLQLRNGVYRKNGSVSKRYGVASLDAANTITDASAGVPFARIGIPVPEEATEYAGSLVRIGGGDLYTWNGQSSTYAWGGTPSNVTVSSDAMPSQASGGVEGATVCVAGNYLVVVYTGRPAPGSANTVVFADVFDATTRAPLAQGRQLSTLIASASYFANPVAVAVGGVVKVMVFSNVTATTPSLQFYSFDPATLISTNGGVFALPNQYANTFSYDLQTDGTNLFAAWPTGSPPTALVVRKMTAAFATISTSTTTLSGIPSSAVSLSLVLSGSQAGVTLAVNTGAAGGGIYSVVVNTATMAAGTATYIFNSPGYVISGLVTSVVNLGGRVVYMLTGSTTAGLIVSGSFNLATGAAVDAPAPVGDGQGRLESRIATVSGLGYGASYYALVSSRAVGALGGTKYLVELLPDTTTSAFRYSRVRATLRPTQSFFGAASAIAAAPSGSTFFVAALLGGYGGTISNAASTNAQTVLTTTAVFTLSFASRAVQSVVANGSLLVSGGAVTAFDGARATEVGFPSPPSAVYTYAFGVIGGLTPSTKYSYAFTWGYQDATGATWESSPVFGGPATALSASQNSIQIGAVPTLSFTTKVPAPTGVAAGSAQTYWVNVYRNTASGTTYYLTGRAQPGANYDDKISDVDLASRAQLIFQAGVVTNDQPPSSQCLAVVGQRVWLGCDDGSVWFSKSFTQGQPVNFSVTFTMQPWEGGVPLAIAALDGTCVVFKRNSIWAISGDGPNDTGLSGSFTSPQLIQSDCGILDPKSIVRIPDGLLFRSDRGLCMLDRKFGVSVIGKPVESAIPPSSTPGQVLSAVLLPKQSVVRFTLGYGFSQNPAGGTLFNHAVDFDYTTGVFSVQTYGFYPAGGQNTPLAACVWQGAWTAFASSGSPFPAVALYQETPGTFVDVYLGAPSFVETRVQTAPIKAAGIQGYERVWKVGVLGVTREACTLNVRLFTDYTSKTVDTPAPQTHAFTVTNQAQWRRGQYQIHVVNQKAEALSVEVWDSAPSTGLSTGEGFVLQGIALEVGVKSGMRRLSAAQKG